MVKRKGKHLSLLLSHRLSTMKNDVCLGSLWERIFDISGRVLFLSKRDCLIKGEKRVYTSFLLYLVVYLDSFRIFIFGVVM